MNAASPTQSRKGVFAVVLGNAVEFFDFGVYATFAVLIGQVFFPSENAFASLMASVITFGVGFVVRPLGAIFIGAWADRVGRKPAMLLTMLLMALGTGGIAVLPGYEQIGIAAPILLVVTRLLQGLAWGEGGHVVEEILGDGAAGEDQESQQQRSALGGRDLAQHRPGSAGFANVGIYQAAPYIEADG